MSNLIMTIDSDSDQGDKTTQPVKAGKASQQKQGKKAAKALPIQQQIIKGDDEDIAINKEFQLDDLVDYSGKSRAGGLSSGPKFENKTLWSYTSAVKTDSGAQRIDPITGEPASATGNIVTLEERIQAKLDEYGVNILETGLINTNAPEVQKPQRE